MKKIKANPRPNKRKSLHSIDVAVGQALQHLRKERGISMDTLATALDLSFQQIQKYESAQNRISVSRLIQICVVLDVTVEKFFKRLGHTHELAAMAGLTNTQTPHSAQRPSPAPRAKASSSA
jgi:transcriptional regulator with XRE-family HTH domain